MVRITEDRGFESISLQQRVRCEPNSRSRGARSGDKTWRSNRREDSGCLPCGARHGIAFTSSRSGTRERETSARRASHAALTEARKVYRRGSKVAPSSETGRWTDDGDDPDSVADPMAAEDQIDDDDDPEAAYRALMRKEEELAAERRITPAQAFENARRSPARAEELGEMRSGAVTRRSPMLMPASSSMCTLMPEASQLNGFLVMWRERSSMPEGTWLFRHEKGRGGVPDEAGRCRVRRRVRILWVDRLASGAGDTTSGQRDLDQERRRGLRHSCTIIKRRTPGGVVGDPERARSRRKSHPPGILKNRIGVRGHVGEIGGQGGDHIAIWPIPRFVVIGENDRGGGDADRGD
jgi:hypothetical protein